MTEPSGDILNAASIDRLLRIGGADLARQMLELFLKHGPERITLAEQGYAAGDMKQIEHATHSLKSSAGNLGAIRLMAASGAVEAAAEAGNSDVLAALMDALRVEYDEASSALKLKHAEITG